MHELIDSDEPKCLYCNSLCDFHIDGISGMLHYEMTILACRNCECKEIFEIHSDMVNNEIAVVGFIFTCREYRVLFNYLMEPRFDIRYRRGNYTCVIPFFTVDFSDKNKLFEKLKTYLIFS